MKYLIFLLDKEVFNKSLDVAWQGMLILFVGMGIIFFSIIFLNHIFKKIKKDK